MKCTKRQAYNCTLPYCFKMQECEQAKIDQAEIDIKKRWDAFFRSINAATLKAIAQMTVRPPVQFREAKPKGNT